MVVRTPDSADSRYLALLDSIREEFPRFRVIKKSDSPLHRAIHYVLIGVTFGGMRSYLSSYQTTIGQRVYVTDDWDQQPAERRYITMRHELIHIRQFARFTLPGLALLYVLFPAPLGLAYLRARFEWEAYTETIRATAEVSGLEAARSPALRERIISQFTGPSYGWMWPFRKQLERWYDRVLADL
mgnify:CR=1 FL=1